MAKSSSSCPDCSSYNADGPKNPCKTCGGKGHLTRMNNSELDALVALMNANVASVNANNDSNKAGPNYPHLFRYPDSDLEVELTRQLRLRGFTLG